MFDHAATGAMGHPCWLDGIDWPELQPAPLPARVDVVVIGAGYTGLNAAIETARGGRGTLVLEAGRAGAGCSTRNGGQISTSVKPGLASLARRHGAARARAIRAEGRAALDWIGTRIAGEGIHCDFARSGRFHAAHTPAAYEAIARSVGAEDGDTVSEGFAVPRAEQHRELGSDFYHGGAVMTRHASLHPGKYCAGLLRRALDAGAVLREETPALALERGRDGVTVHTPAGRVLARDVIVATNGYSGPLVPWLQRRVIPIGSYVIATEALDPALVGRLFPTGRIASDSRRVVYYYRPSPDGRRVVFGGRVSAGETDLSTAARRLREEMVRIFPALEGAAVSHAWMGRVGYSFDTLAHKGVHEGIHYALGYCGSGVSMASWLGMKTGRSVLGLDDGRTAFDGLPFPTRPLYHGRPWFLPAAVAWYRWRDARDVAKSKKTVGSAQGT